MIYLPIIGSVMEAAGMIIEKKILKQKSVNFKNYVVYEFLAIVLVMLPLLYFVWGLDSRALELKNILLFSLVVFVSVIANLLVFYSLKREKVTEFEPIWLMQPFFTILLAFTIYADERNWYVIGLAIIASMTLVLSHVKKHHLAFDKYIFAALLGGFCFSLELVISKSILEYYSPFSFYFLRCLFIFLICFMLFNNEVKKVKGTTVLQLVIVGLLWIFYRAIMYYGYGSMGIVFTTILFILSPVFLFIFAAVFLKEKPTMRNIISSIVIVLCVIGAIILNASA